MGSVGGGSGGSGTGSSAGGGSSSGSGSGGNDKVTNGNSNTQLPVLDNYLQGRQLAGTAWKIFNNPDAGLGGWAISGGYLLLWGGAHAALAVGVAGLACVAAGPGCVVAVEGALGIGGTTAIGVQQASNALAPYYPPNQGFLSEPTELTLRAGDIIARRGGPGGRFFSPPGLSAGQLSLPPGSENLAENLFVVQKPFTVYMGEVAPWFSQIGGGTVLFICNVSGVSGGC